MGLERQLEKLVQQKKIEKCPLCQNRMQYISGGRYRCSFCGTEALDDFGKIKAFLEQNGPTPSVIIAQQTGLSVETIESYLKRGMVEIPEGEAYYLQCEKCGCDIRYGRFCIDCAMGRMQANKKVTYQDIGEKPKQNINLERTGKMHYNRHRER